MPEHTPEHEAWVRLVERLAYLDQFAGNRSENKKFTEMVEKIWKEEQS